MRTITTQSLVRCNLSKFETKNRKIEEVLIKFCYIYIHSIIFFYFLFFLSHQTYFLYLFIIALF